MIASEVQRFNEIIRETFESLDIDSTSHSSLPFRNAALLYLPNDTQSVQTNRDLDNIAWAKEARQTATTFAEVISQSTLSCAPPHQVWVHLTGFDEPTIEMTMSLCSSRSSIPPKKLKWHTIRCSCRKSRSNGVYQPCAERVCEKLQESYRSRNMLQIEFERDGSWRDDLGDRLDDRATAPSTALKDLLRFDETGKVSHMPLFQLEKRDKLELAVTVSRSLAFLLGNCLLQDRWCPDNIHVTQTANKSLGEGVRTNTYVLGSLQGHKPEDDAKISAFERSLMLDLGVLLWELFFEERVAPESEDEESDDDENGNASLLNALNRKQMTSRRKLFLEKACIDVIGNCLELCSQRGSAISELQRDIYWHVVKPLRDYLLSYNKIEPNEPERVPAGSKDRETTTLSIHPQRQQFLSANPATYNVSYPIKPRQQLSLTQKPPKDIGQCFVA